MDEKLVILSAIELFWRTHPYLRWGQVVELLTKEVKSAGKDPFYISNLEWVKTVNSASREYTEG